MLNKKQIEAVKHMDGPAMVLAGPGTGKTTVIAHRLLNMIKNENVNPKCILVMTFTKAAAKEMKERFEKIAGIKEVANKVTFGTFHSIFFKILNESGHTLSAKQVATEESKYRIIKEIVLRNGYKVSDMSNFIRDIVSAISVVKGNDINPAEYKRGDCSAEMFVNIFTEYEESLDAQNMLDFEDMIAQCHELLKNDAKILHYWRDMYKYILVDEFQDINMLQYENLKLLAMERKNVFVVGDDDQTIYGFRGSNPQIMYKFVDEFEKVKKIYLDVNYRSRQEIMEVADNLIKNSSKRFSKRINSFSGMGGKVDIRIFENNLSELKFVEEKIKVYLDMGIKKENIAILVRNNAQVLPVRNYLNSRDIEVVSKYKYNIYSHPIAKDIYAYIASTRYDLKSSLIECPYLVRIINKPNRYISERFVYPQGPGLEELLNEYNKSQEIKGNLNKLMFHINMIKQLEPYAAINYIRYGVGYEAYLKDYAKIKGLEYKEVGKIYERIMAESSAFDSLEKWMGFVQEKMNEKEVIDDKKGIEITTMHSVKGLEYEVVFLMDVNQGIIPTARAQRENGIEEERRLMYVAVTRAISCLHVLSTRKIMGKKYEPSQFVFELSQCLQF